VPQITDVQLIIDDIRSAASKGAEEMAAVHGKLWEDREGLAKLIISLSSTILVATIIFSSNFLGQNVTTTSYPSIIVLSWTLLYLSMCFVILSLWHSNNLKSFRARLFNFEPALRNELYQMDDIADEGELNSRIKSIVKKYIHASLKPLETADRCAYYSYNIAIVLFVLGVGAFLVFGASLVM